MKIFLGFLSCLCILGANIPFAFAFAPLVGHSSSPGPLTHHRLDAHAASHSDSFLLEDFKTSDGEVLNPYRVLKVSRSAETTEIKRAYRELSRRYHPDGVRYRDILPGSCNNLDEVRDHWERIRMSYEILKNPKLRKRYNRHEALADPGKAMQRAAVDAAIGGIVGVGKGLFDMGSMAISQMAKQTKTGE